MSAALVSRMLDAPVDPDVEQAREWIIRELAKPPYRAAEPSWFDRLASAFWDWLTSLQFGGAGSPSLIWGLIALAVIGGLVAIYFLFGAPRRNRRSASVGALFGQQDQRSASALRRSASDAAASGDFALAIEELFRAIARGLTERAIVDVFPGTTATTFADGAGRYFSAYRHELAASARDFDDVRYLDRPGTEEAYLRMSSLDASIGAATPELAADDTVAVPA